CIPKAEASLPSARERNVSCATPAMESTIASRNCSNFSFCALVKASSRRGLWLSRKISAADSEVRSRLAFARTLFGFALLVDGCFTAFFAGLAGLRAADFFALEGVAFFFNLAIKIKSRDALAARGERIIKNKSTVVQGKI